MSISNTYLNSTERSQVEDGTSHAVSCRSACPAGEYGVCVAAGSCWSCKLNTCLKCTSGKYSRAGAASEAECLLCEIGKFNNQSASTTCSVCGPGHFTSDGRGVGVSSQATACTECPAGSYQEEGSSYQCLLCEKGKSSSRGSKNCTACVAGRFASSTGTTECIECESGKKTTSFVAAEGCTKCTSPFSSWKGSTNCSICKDGYYEEDKTCHECPRNGECPLGTTKANININSGYWRLGPDSIRILECTSSPGACLGGNGSSPLCQDNSKGPFCAICELDYARASETDKCRSCAKRRGLDSSFWVLLSFASIILVVFCIYLKQQHNGVKVGEEIHEIIEIYGELKTKLKIVLSFTQVVSSFPSQFDVPFPDSFSAICAQLKALTSLDVYGLFPRDCFMDYRTNIYIQELLFQTLAPLALAGLLGSWYVIRRWCCGGGLSEETLRRYHDSTMFWFLLLTYMVLVPCSSVVLGVFNCYSVGSGTSFMHADYSTECETPVHDLMRIYAGIFVFVYPIGIPAMYLAILYRKRHAIDPILPETHARARMTDNPEDVETAITIRSADHQLGPLRFLFESYEPEFWFWEILVCFERLLLTSSSIYVSSQLLQPFTVLMITLFCVKLYSALDPYIEDSDDLFAEISQWFIIATVIMALVFQVNAASPSSGIGTLMNVILLLLLIIFSYYCLTSLFKEIYFFEEMFPDTTKACTALVASKKASFVKVFYSRGFEPENSRDRDGGRHGTGLEMKSNEPHHIAEEEMTMW
eukprot:CAMPEP_0185755014 /NCGR_PEP_ID=MMETSP1174-20130828/13561_1 /TAXON_ID=35687 /ORGANISM="Dictyocha speculum, Strain CCMP1381" /LENGTH=758 /DNA_ID=CAMNT_0028433427 /DNA_START=174 /DNA_END=2447 /DNA_ORIENTATION=+